MKKLKFKGFKAEMILRGEKTATMRLFDDKDLKVGDRLELENSDNNQIFAQAIISEVVEKKIEEIVEEDLRGHERWEDSEAMLSSFRKYYGDQVTPATAAKIVRFVLSS